MSNQPFHFPCDPQARVITQFGQLNAKMYQYTGGRHTGTDYIAAPNSPIYAMTSGRVVEAGYAEKGGYGRRVVIDHGEYQTLYGQLHTVGVRVDDSVTLGMVIGSMGSGLQDAQHGASHGTHLHFEIILPREVPGSILTYRGYCIDVPTFCRLHSTPKYEGTALTNLHVRNIPDDQSPNSLVYDTLRQYTSLYLEEIVEVGKSAAHADLWGKLQALRPEYVAVRIGTKTLVDYTNTAVIEAALTKKKIIVIVPPDVEVEVRRSDSSA